MRRWLYDPRFVSVVMIEAGHYRVQDEELWDIQQDDDTGVWVAIIRGAVSTVEHVNNAPGYFVRRTLREVLSAIHHGPSRIKMTHPFEDRDYPAFEGRRLLPAAPA